MNARESVGIALDALRANKLRSFLTLIGVIIGVASVIAVMSVVQGLDRYVGRQLTAAGADVFSVDRVGVEFDFTKIGEKLRRRRFEPADAEAVARSAEHVEAAVATVDGSATVARGSHRLRRVQLHGVQAGYPGVEDFPLARGRVLGEADDRDRAPTCVLGQEVADELFPHGEALGEYVRANGRRLTVVGIGARKGSAFGQSQDLYVLVPLESYRKWFGHDESVTIRVRSRGQEAFARAQDETRSLLRLRRHLRPAAPDDFEIVTPDMYLGLWRNLSGAISIVIVGVSMISLFVGGIVIMNIMLVSVTERTKEIGLRKALGASRRDVLGQFLIEAVTLSGVGGLIGMLSGAGFAVLLGLATPLPTYVSPWAVALGLLSSTAVGVFFGAYPAARAARLDPIEALRYE